MFSLCSFLFILLSSLIGCTSDPILDKASQLKEERHKTQINHRLYSPNQANQRSQSRFRFSKAGEAKRCHPKTKPKVTISGRVRILGEGDWGKPIRIDVFDEISKRLMVPDPRLYPPKEWNNKEVSLSVDQKDQSLWLGAYCDVDGDGRPGPMILRDGLRKTRYPLRRIAMGSWSSWRSLLKDAQKKNHNDCCGDSTYDHHYIPQIMDQYRSSSFTMSKDVVLQHRPTSESPKHRLEFRWVVVCNDDIDLPLSDLQEMILQIQEDAGAISPMIEDDQGTNVPASWFPNGDGFAWSSRWITESWLGVWNLYDDSFLGSFWCAIQAWIWRYCTVFFVAKGERPSRFVGLRAADMWVVGQFHITHVVFSLDLRTEFDFILPLPCLGVLLDWVFYRPELTQAYQRSLERISALEGAQFEYHLGLHQTQFEQDQV